ncbi:MAG: sterol desaturase family protein [Nannocystaceae bacterium]|nr:sterol desaturase family protein [Nannocystaceae bacterium]
MIGETHSQSPSSALASSVVAPPSVATWFILPFMLAAVSVGTWKLLGTDLPRPAASGIPLLVSVVAILVLERFFPLHRAWNRRPDAADLILLVVNRGVDLALLGGTVALIAVLGDTLRGVSLWPTSWPVALQVVAGITIGEFLRYAMHRYSHRPGLWWAVHRTHHQPERMYSLNGPRLHPLNYLWVSAAHGVPMLLLGAPVEVVLVVMNVTALFVVFQHANLKLRFDGINRVFATPDVHRIHHARQIVGIGANFSIVLVLVDLIFGTYAPADTEVAVDGIGSAGPQGS